MGFLSGWSLKNPLQPLTHAAGSAVGVTANTKNGVHVDPSKLVTDAMALTGNPYAIAAVGGNLLSAVDPNSGLDTLGRTVSTVGNAGAMFTGGATAALKKAGAVAQAVPGMGSIETALGKVPGASKVAGSISSLFGLGGGDTAPPAGGATGGGAPTSAGGWEDPTGNVLGNVGVGATGAAPTGGGGIMDKIGSLFGIQSGQMTPEDKMRLAQMGLGAIGGAVSGYENQKNQAGQLDLARAEGGRTLARAADTAPLRDRALARLASYTSQAPAPFTPHDFTTAQFSGPGATGGYNQPKLASDAASYQPGQGGVNTALYQHLLNMAGVTG